MEIEVSPPRPIDNRQVAQAIVEYTGRRLGAVTYRGPSRREYRFSAFPSDSKQYVLDEDLDHFRRLVDFQVLEETRIDPEEERLRTFIAEALERQRVETAVAVGRASERERESETARRPSKRGGRPAGKGFGAMLDCWMTCGRLGECYGSSKEAYDAIRDYLEQHTSADQYAPPRARFASMRSDAKRKRERAGHCTWHRHPEPVPEELMSA